MAVSDLKVLLAGVDGLGATRVQGAAELTDLIARKALPNAPLWAFVLPAGIRVRDEGEASTGAFVQSIDEVFAIVLVVKSAGDPTGEKKLGELDQLIWAVIDAVAGEAPDDQAIGDYRLQRGQLVSVVTGAIFYQLDFAVQSQVRITE